MSNQPIAELTHSGSKKSVLVADPAVANCSQTVEFLLDEGYQVLQARSVQEAVSLLSSQKISHALLELQFGDGDGFALVAQIRETNPHARILVHSAFCTVAVAVRATKAGASDVVPKPVETDFLLALLLGLAPAETLLTPDEVRREHIESVYAACDGNVTKTARELSMHRRTLQRILTRSAVGFQVGHAL